MPKRYRNYKEKRLQITVKSNNENATRTNAPYSDCLSHVMVDFYYWWLPVTYLCPIPGLGQDCLLHVMVENEARESGHPSHLSTLN